MKPKTMQIQEQQLQQQQHIDAMAENESESSVNAGETAPDPAGRGRAAVVRGRGRGHRAIPMPSGRVGRGGRIVCDNPITGVVRRGRGSRGGGHDTLGNQSSGRGSRGGVQGNRASGPGSRGGITRSRGGGHAARGKLGSSVGRATMSTRETTADTIELGADEPCFASTSKGESAVTLSPQMRLRAACEPNKSNVHSDNAIVEALFTIDQSIVGMLNKRRGAGCRGGVPTTRGGGRGSRGGGRGSRGGGRGSRGGGRGSRGGGRGSRGGGRGSRGGGRGSRGGGRGSRGGGRGSLSVGTATIPTDETKKNIIELAVEEPCLASTSMGDSAIAVRPQLSPHATCEPNKFNVHSDVANAEASFANDLPIVETPKSRNISSPRKIKLVSPASTSSPTSVVPPSESLGQQTCRINTNAEPIHLLRCRLCDREKPGKYYYLFAEFMEESKSSEPIPASPDFESFGSESPERKQSCSRDQQILVQSNSIRYSKKNENEAVKMENIVEAANWLQLEIKKNDGMSQNICEICARRFGFLYSFGRRSIKAQEAVRQKHNVPSLRARLPEMPAPIPDKASLTTRVDLDPAIGIIGISDHSRRYINLPFVTKGALKSFSPTKNIKNNDIDTEKPHEPSSPWHKGNTSVTTLKSTNFSSNLTASEIVTNGIRSDCDNPIPSTSSAAAAHHLVEKSNEERPLTNLDYENRHVERGVPWKTKAERKAIGCSPVAVNRSKVFATPIVRKRGRPCKKKRNIGLKRTSQAKESCNADNSEIQRAIAECATNIASTEGVNTNDDSQFNQGLDTEPSASIMWSSPNLRNITNESDSKETVEISQVSIGTLRTQIEHSEECSDSSSTPTVLETGEIALNDDPSITEESTDLKRRNKRKNSDNDLSDWSEKRLREIDFENQEGSGITSERNVGSKTPGMQDANTKKGIEGRPAGKQSEESFEPEMSAEPKRKYKPNNGEETVKSSTVLKETPGMHDANTTKEIEGRPAGKQSEELFEPEMSAKPKRKYKPNNGDETAKSSTVLKETPGMQDANTTKGIEGRPAGKQSEESFEPEMSAEPKRKYKPNNGDETAKSSTALKETPGMQDANTTKEIEGRPAGKQSEESFEPDMSAKPKRKYKPYNGEETAKSSTVFKDTPHQSNESLAEFALLKRGFKLKTAKEECGSDITETCHEIVSNFHDEPKRKRQDYIDKEEIKPICEFEGNAVNTIPLISTQNLQIAQAFETNNVENEEARIEFYETVDKHKNQDLKTTNDFQGTQNFPISLMPPCNTNIVEGLNRESITQLENKKLYGETTEVTKSGSLQSIVKQKSDNLNPINDFGVSLIDTISLLPKTNTQIWDLSEQVSQKQQDPNTINDVEASQQLKYQDLQTANDFEATQIVPMSLMSPCKVHNVVCPKRGPLTQLGNKKLRVEATEFPKIGTKSSQSNIKQQSENLEPIIDFGASLLETITLSTENITPTWDLSENLPQKHEEQKTINDIESDEAFETIEKTNKIEHEESTNDFWLDNRKSSQKQHSQFLEKQTTLRTTFPTVFNLPEVEDSDREQSFLDSLENLFLDKSLNTLTIRTESAMDQQQDEKAHEPTNYIELKASSVSESSANIQYFEDSTARELYKSIENLKYSDEEVSQEPDENEIFLSNFLEEPATEIEHNVLETINFRNPTTQEQQNNVLDTALFPSINAPDERPLDEDMIIQSFDHSLFQEQKSIVTIENQSTDLQNPELEQLITVQNISCTDQNSSINAIASADPAAYTCSNIHTQPPQSTSDAEAYLLTNSPGSSRTSSVSPNDGSSSGSTGESSSGSDSPELCSSEMTSGHQNSLDCRFSCQRHDQWKTLRCMKWQQKTMSTAQTIPAQAIPAPTMADQTPNSWSGDVTESNTMLSCCSDCCEPCVDRNCPEQNEAHCNGAQFINYVTDQRVVLSPPQTEPDSTTSATSLRQFRRYRAPPSPPISSQTNSFAVFSTPLSPYQDLGDDVTRSSQHDCQVCAKRYANVKALRKHHQQAHINQHEMPFVCPICRRGFRMRTALHRHMETHDTVGRPYECEYCLVRFPHSSQLTLHMLSVHSNKRTYMCERCGDQLISEKALADHMKLHKAITDTHIRWDPFSGALV